MRFDDTVLYEQFVTARIKAVEITDRYRGTPAEDPSRVVLWEAVIRETEVARGLLECWLRSDRAEPARVTTKPQPQQEQNEKRTRAAVGTRH